MAKRNGEDKVERTSLGVTIEARDALVAYLATRHNPVMRDVVTTLILRFLALPDPLKTAVLNNVDEGMEAAYADALEELARQLRQKAGEPRFAELVHMDMSGPEDAKRPGSPSAAEPARKASHAARRK